MKHRVSSQNWSTHPWVESLASALCLQRSKPDMKHFLRDLLTTKELEAIGERIEIAKLLNKGLSYREVAAQIGVSTTTVTRVAKNLQDGCGGFARHFKLNEQQSSSLEGLAALQERRQQQSANSLRKFL